jgi:hypothetical protein
MKRHSPEPEICELMVVKVNEALHHAVSPCPGSDSPLALATTGLCCWSPAVSEEEAMMVTSWTHL